MVLVEHDLMRGWWQPGCLKAGDDEAEVESEECGIYSVL